MDAQHDEYTGDRSVAGSQQSAAQLHPLPGETVGVSTPANVTDAVTLPAAGAAGLLTLKLQLVVARAGSVGDAQLDTGTVTGAWPERLTVRPDMVAGDVAVFVTDTLPAT